MQHPEKIWPGHEHGFQFHVAILHVRVSGVPQLNRLPMRFVSKFEDGRATKRTEVGPCFYKGGQRCIARLT
jgi:hypothetical protein